MHRDGRMATATAIQAITDGNGTGILTMGETGVGLAGKRNAITVIKTTVSTGGPRLGIGDTAMSGVITGATVHASAG